MSAEKTSLHPRNKHRFRYDFPELIKSHPELKNYVAVNSYGDQSIDFSDPEAVKCLNKALLKHFYGISYWDIPTGYLCPPIPGRADYIHYLADLLASVNNGIVPTRKSVRGLDVGIGANCVYPIVGHQEYRWSFVGSEVDSGAIKAVKAIISSNPELVNAVVCRPQSNKHHIFKGIIKPGDLFDFTMCNPPFHSSAEEAQAGTKRKLHNLGKQKGKGVTLNFGGQNTELWYEGGEVGFIRNMIEESVAFGNQCLWFSTLVSKSSNLSFIYKALQYAKVAEVRTVEMSQGQKVSRFVAWTFMSIEKQNNWSKTRWDQQI
jgi:23S rRNA (adenine1618-N6)-methyltransferase